MIKQWSPLATRVWSNVSSRPSIAPSVIIKMASQARIRQHWWALQTPTRPWTSVLRAASCSSTYWVHPMKWWVAEARNRHRTRSCTWPNSIRQRHRVRVISRTHSSTLNRSSTRTLPRHHWWCSSRSRSTRRPPQHPKWLSLPRNSKGSLNRSNIPAISVRKTWRRGTPWFSSRSLNTS